QAKLRFCKAPMVGTERAGKDLERTWKGAGGRRSGRGRDFGLVLLATGDEGGVEGTGRGAAEKQQREGEEAEQGGGAGGGPAQPDKLRRHADQQRAERRHAALEQAEDAEQASAHRLLGGELHQRLGGDAGGDEAEADDP